MTSNDASRTCILSVYLVILLIWLVPAAMTTTGCSISEETDEVRENVTQTIGPEGGVVEVTDSSSAIYGAKVYIPPYSLDQDVDIAITLTDIPQGLPIGNMAAGRCINFIPDGIEFAQPIRMYLPYVDTNNDGIIDGQAVVETNVGILYYNDSSNQWEEMGLYATEMDENLAVIESEHFSTYLTFIDTSDSEPYDTGVPSDQTGDEPSTFNSGDCYLDDSYDGLCNYYYLTITRRDSDLLALIDRNATYTTNGYPTVIDESGGSATFDAASAFSRVLSSGDASLWQWEGEFVREHTYLKDYEVEDDPLTGGTSATNQTDNGNIYCRIEVVDAAMVRIIWQVDVNEQIVFPSTPQGSGHMLVIKFRATYQ
jgi:hypothetical protein